MKNDDLEQYEYDASLYGMTLEDYMNTNLGYESVDAYVASRMESYRKNAVLYLAAQAIAEKENLTVTAEDMVGYSDYVEEYGEPYIKQFILFQEIIPTFIAENGNPNPALDEAAAE